ncbi:hypothetical protein AQUCO_05800148v1 [Aquilegia coerulea]|uniref:DUF538 domain-containing protein n=1 Tax=Aquilegia coerulea TaxID=218851 RepID=A0A2G5CF45_AQUCA|nr:hypothetical protein AQUCO_05800148v1 [Aquilegia coerulea]
MMNSSSILSIFLLFNLIISSFSSDSDSIYEVLQSHGLPIGIIPKGVKEFSLDDKGRFEVHLDQACDAKFENTVHYDRNVTGVLSYGQIQGLSGISAQELFLWFPVKGIRVDIPSSGIIYFDVGVIYKRFSLSLFETPPECKISDHDKLFKDFEEGQALATSVSKSLPGKLRYELDQDYTKRAEA